MTAPRRDLGEIQDEGCSQDELISAVDLLESPGWLAFGTNSVWLTTFFTVPAVGRTSARAAADDGLSADLLTEIASPTSAAALTGSCPASPFAHLRSSRGRARSYTAEEGDRERLPSHAHNSETQLVPRGSRSPSRES
jgi:hypothetical protein